MRIFGLLLAAAALSGCCVTNYTPCTQRVVTQGTVGGALIGGVIGHTTGGISTLEGVAVGALAGAAVGTLAADSLCYTPGYGAIGSLPPANKSAMVPPPPPPSRHVDFSSSSRSAQGK